MQLEQLVGGHPAREAEELREIAERRPGLPRSCPRTTHLRVPGRGPHQAARDLDERGLPGAVRPQQADELAVAGLEGDTAERFDRAVSLDEAAGGGRRGHDPERTLPPFPRGYGEGPGGEEAEGRR